MENIEQQVPDSGSLPERHSYGCAGTNQPILGGILQERYTEGGSVTW